ncbi:hypothetical protein LTR66_017709 [Elasticomyces elasticus]|nr:hypothetical protein LTR66_017709 [Elasticomyces elasticus]
MSSEVITAYHSRNLDQEPDTVTIVPRAPDYLLLGTYSLVKNDSDETDAEQARKGSLQFLRFNAEQPESTGLSSVSSPKLDRKDFDFGIYDLHFHPIYTGLLGVATSNAEILFYHSQAKYTAQDLLVVGKIQVEECQPGQSPAIITQFQFIVEAQDASSVTIHEHEPAFRTILLAATTQFGATKVMQVDLPTDHDERLRTQG